MRLVVGAWPNSPTMETPVLTISHLYRQLAENKLNYTNLAEHTSELGLKALFLGLSASRGELMHGLAHEAALEAETLPNGTGLGGIVDRVLLTSQHPDAPEDREATLAAAVRRETRLLEEYDKLIRDPTTAEHVKAVLRTHHGLIEADIAAIQAVRYA